MSYGSAFALSTAFKRVRGISPREHREGAVGLSAPAGRVPPATVVLPV